MAKHAFVAFSTPIPGQEDEFNRWYDDVHVHDLLTVEGIVSAQRYELADQQVMPGPNKYMTIYEVETDDLDAWKADFVSKVAGWERTNSLQRETASSLMYTPSGNPVRK